MTGAMRSPHQKNSRTDTFCSGSVVRCTKCGGGAAMGPLSPLGT
ncbi:hypothetical protein OH687_20625 [Burkholderia anthina]|nr:hypothetical protein OH687_20625 [Burkholderia anthina]